MVRRCVQRHNSRLPQPLVGADMVKNTPDLPGEGFNASYKVQSEAGHIHNIVLKAPMGIETSGCRRIH